jgi:hypothetical protein
MEPFDAGKCDTVAEISHAFSAFAAKVVWTLELLKVTFFITLV